MCSHSESKGGLSATNVSAALDEATVQSVSPAFALDHAASFDDQPLDGGEPAEYDAPSYPAEHSPDSSDSDTRTSEGDDYDDDRFSAYESDATDDGADDNRLVDEDEDEDGNASEEEYQSSPSETDSDVSVLSTGYGDSQLLVDITLGDAANYTLPPDDRRFSNRLVFQDAEGAYDMAICPRCAEAGEVYAERALWCPGREREEACLLHPGAGPVSELQRATASRVNELNDLSTSSPSELADDPLKRQDEDMDAQMGGYNFGHITLEDPTYMEDDGVRGGRTDHLSATPPSQPAKRLTLPTSSVTCSSKSFPFRATNAQGQRRAKTVKAAASVPRASQVERGSTGGNAGVIQIASPKERTGSSMVNHREGSAKVPTLASSVSRASYTLPAPTPARNSTGLMLPPPLPRPTSTSSPASGPYMRQTTRPTAAYTHTNPHGGAPQTTPRKRFRDPDSDSEPELLATAPRERSASVSWESPSSTPRKKTRMERRGECETSMLEGEDNLEWGLDLDAGVEIARTFPQRQHHNANETSPTEHGSRE
ncbi:hypothetical protein CcaverHIS002_0502680 [Cutaneotrichosporon cavernicola]|uniref:Uncharacterized protein n=1 Tax=Cutaneotrichosporon cavernicola TaxID=279322 RepID=A0AA48L671_9TREE|nr:uncharacterized protein CcaverHIS019_0503250 [Cutaneotrichosporon cavernicola]BEI84867.1 hypothetical protein CcaverHIS002_0502680 [Cutaneotrichosporon cavernicola]BEI92697.1 hypothetical protein CcaverHIS019_0503250 [Cutaneotrichosporon cavernicola]